MSKTTKIRWVIAHDPIYLFYRAAKDFEASLNAQQSAEKIEIEIMTPAEYSERYNNGEAITKHDLLNLMDQGRLEMSQMYTTWIAERYVDDFLAFELPFIFKDHDHAARVLEGPVGEGLLDQLNATGQVRGLCYTYSGGFCMVNTGKEVTSLADLVGMTMRSNRNPVAQAIWKAVDVNPYVCEIEDTASKFEDNQIDAADVTFSRIYPLGLDKHTKSVVDTQHKLFLTTMLISEKFWNTLSPEVQKIIKTAAMEAGRKERDETIRDGEEAKQKLESEGKNVVALSEQEKAEFAKLTAVVYDQFKTRFKPGLVDQIQNS